MEKTLYALIDQLERGHSLRTEDFVALLCGRDDDLTAYAREKAVALRKRYYGTDVFVRGLIEFTNYCKNNCYYCGIRRSNQNAQRYRLTEEDILTCCKEGYTQGFRTFVLQGGEDPYFTDDIICRLIKNIKTAHQDCAVTLSIGEKSRESYQAFFNAGADRYLLRHETANEAHYEKLHPAALSAANRKHCLFDLKEIGYQVGAGFMVGSPFQTAEHLAEDLCFLKELNPHMVGIGPFIPHKDTPFSDEPAGTLEKTLFLLSLIRIMLPQVLLPATTALGTIHVKGRELGILAGANVVMPNLSPVSVRNKYLLYDNKICTGEESAKCKDCLSARMEQIGYRIVTDRGDYRTQAVTQPERSPL